MTTTRTRRVNAFRNDQDIHPYLVKHPDFPLSWHKRQQRWYKTLRRKTYYFGHKGCKPVEALDQYQREWPYIARGEAIPDFDNPEGVETRLCDLVNDWLHDRRGDVEIGSLDASTWSQYKMVTNTLLRVIDRNRIVSSLGPADFSLLFRRINQMRPDSPSVVGTFVTVTKMVFKWGVDMDLTESVKYGPKFKKPSISSIQEKRHRRGRQHYNTDEIKAMLDVASVHMQAFILLGVNGGMTQAEVSAIHPKDIDLDAGFIDYYRKKSTVYRRIPLWDITVEAVRAAMKDRPSRDPKHIFLTRQGNPWESNKLLKNGNMSRSCGIAQEFGKITKKCKITLEQSGFGKLRHTHRTLADSAVDTNASKTIMGHRVGDNYVESTYIRSISDERLIYVVNHVYQDIFGTIKGNHGSQKLTRPA